jgi:predicted flap endonuclease-1-like 5' DNA nuclease
VIIISAFNLILQVLAMLGGTTFSQVLPAVVVNGLALLLALLPGTRDAFRPPRKTAVSLADQAATNAAVAANAAAATAEARRTPEATPVMDDMDFEAAVDAAETDAPPIEETPADPAEVSRTSSGKTMPAPPASELELTIIEGIGPKISAALKAAGINSIYKLSAVTAAELRTILQDAGLSADPTTWPEQAQMAADGDLAGLKAYQQALVGGREA